MSAHRLFYYNNGRHPENCLHPAHRRQGYTHWTPNDKCGLKCCQGSILWTPDDTFYRNGALNVEAAENDEVR